MKRYSWEREMRGRYVIRDGHRGRYKRVAVCYDADDAESIVSALNEAEERRS